MSDFTTNQYSALNETSNSASGDGKAVKDELGKKRSRISDAKQLRKTDRWDERWNDFIKIYSNKYPYSQLDDYDDVVVPNMVFSTVNVIVPALAVNRPNIEVEPTQLEDVGPAKLTTSVVNNQWRTGDVQLEVRRSVKDFVICGHGWAKTVWESKEEEVDFTRDEFQQIAAQTLMQKRQAEASGNGDLFPDDAELIESLPTTHTVTTVDAPKVERVSIFDMFVDPDCTVLENARWLAQRSFIPIQVAKDNPEYSKKVRSRLTRVNISKARENVDVESQSNQSNDSGFVEIWEYYDLVSGEMCVFAEGTEGHLIAPEKAPFPKGHPFSFLENYEVPERLYPIGDVETIHPLQLELGMVRTAQLNDRKRGRRITLFREAALGSDGVQSLRAGEDNVMIPVLKDLAFDDVFRQISSQGLPPEWYAADQQAMSDIDLVSGVSEYARGGESEIRRTATEIGAMQDNSNTRISDKLSKVEGFMSDIAERMVRLSQEFMDSEQIAKIVTDQDAVEWVQYGRQDLQGDFTFKVEAGSSQPVNESFKRQKAGQVMDMFGAMIGSGLLNDQEFIKEVLTLLDFKDPARLMGPGIPPPQPEMIPPGEEPTVNPSQPGGSQMPPGMM